MTAAATAPGATSGTVTPGAVASRNTNTNTAALRPREPASTATFTAPPRDPAPLLPRWTARSSPRTAIPAVASSSRLRPRALNGLGRLLRGTDQAVFMAYCTAWATPSPP